MSCIWHFINDDETEDRMWQYDYNITAWDTGINTVELQHFNLLIML